MSKEIITKGKLFKQTIDRLPVSADETSSKEGYRLLRYHSSTKAENDAQRRARQLQRATQGMTEFRDRLQCPKTRFRERSKADPAV